MPATANPLPHVNQPWVDPDTGLPTQVFYQFMTTTFPRGVDTLANIVRLIPQRFNQLPSQPEEGMVASVIDAQTNGWGDRVNGGGSFHVLAYHDGRTWTVAGR